MGQKSRLIKCNLNERHVLTSREIFYQSDVNSTHIVSNVHRIDILYIMKVGLRRTNKPHNTSSKSKSVILVITEYKSKYLDF